MQNIFVNSRIKMALVLLFVFLSVKAVVPNVFIADTPNVDPLFVAKIINTPSQIAAMPGRFLSSLGNIRLNLFNSSTESNNLNNLQVDPVSLANVKEVVPPQNVVFKFVSKGVSAAEDPATGNKYIKVAAGTQYKIVGYITINGKQYPKIEFVK